MPSERARKAVSDHWRRLKRQPGAFRGPLKDVPVFDRAEQARELPEHLREVELPDEDLDDFLTEKGW